MTRRSFISSGIAVAALGGMPPFLGLPPISAAEARLPAERVRFHTDIEPLVRWLEDAPREGLLGEAVHRIRRGLTYRDLLTALFLAGLRNIQPRPIGFKFHAVLVIHSAHQASLESAEGDRWLPILWAIDQFKRSQAADVREGDWALGAPQETSLPPGHKAREAFVEAMDKWDESGADAAITSLARTAGAGEVFDLLCRYGLRDFREIGHKQIYISNAFRVLDVIGWRHAEPVLRGVVYGLLDTLRDPNPSKSDLPPDRPGRRNRERLGEIPTHWLEGKSDDNAVRGMLEATREGSALDASGFVIGALGRGVSPASIFDGLHAACAELLLRQPGLVAMHAWTTTNAARYAWNRVQDDQTRRFILLQNAAFLPLFRGEPRNSGVRLDQLPQSPPQKAGIDALEEVFSGKVRDAAHAQRLLAWLEAGNDPAQFAAAARRWTFAKGTDSHDYKFSSAFLEDYRQISGPWRNRYLAASMLYLRGAGDGDSPVFAEIRDALKS